MEKIIKRLSFIILLTLLFILPLSVQADGTLEISYIYEDENTYYSINNEGKYTYEELRCELLLLGEPLDVINLFPCEKGTPVGYYEDGSPYYSQREYDIYIKRMEQEKQEDIDREKKFLEECGYSYVTREEAERIIEDCKTKPCPAGYKIFYDGAPMQDCNTNKNWENDIRLSSTYREAVWTYIIKNYPYKYFSVCDIHINALNKIDITNEQYEKALKMINDVADKNNYGSDFDKIKRIAQWEVSEFTYDESAAYRTDIYNTMTTKKTVCVGYAGVFQLCMERMGIESYMLGIPSHSLNVVKLDGKYYFVDVTWMEGNKKGGWEDYNELWLLYGREMSDVNCSLPISQNRYDMSFYDKYKINVESKIMVINGALFSGSYTAFLVQPGNSAKPTPSVPPVFVDNKGTASDETDILETTFGETADHTSPNEAPVSTAEAESGQYPEINTKEYTTEIEEITAAVLEENTTIADITSDSNEEGLIDDGNGEISTEMLQYAGSVSQKSNRWLITGIVIAGCLAAGTIVFVVIFIRKKREHEQ